MKRIFTRRNVAGVIFSSKGAYRSIDAWLEAKAPNDSRIYDTPGNLIRAGLTIVDARKVDGMYYRAKLSIPSETKVTAPRNVNKLVDPRTIPPKVFPGLIFFDADSAKHRPRQIGTSAPSKISRSEAKPPAEEKPKAKTKDKK